MAGGSSLRNLLFVGPKGCGKRTVGKELAASFNMEFLPVPMGEPAGKTQELLFGTQGEAVRAADGGPLPGVLGAGQATLVYLERFHAVAQELFLPLQQVISRRRYSAADGKSYRLSEDVVIVAGLRDREPDALVTPEHFLSTAFDAQVHFSVPLEAAELAGIASGMLKTLDARRALALDVGPFLREVAQSGDHLHAVKRLLALAARLAPEGAMTIDAVALRSAWGEDIESHLSRIEYRGRAPTMNQFRRWQEQFPAELHPVTVDIIRLIADRYYLSTRQYWVSLDRLVAEADLGSVRGVFCLWQPFGKSNPGVMHDLKTHQKLRVMQHLDLTAPPANWPQLILRPPVFIVVDDFVGTGGTLCSLWEEEPRRLVWLLDQYPGSRAVLLAVAALDSGVRKVRESLRRHLPGRARFLVGTEFDERDRCFSETSRAVPHPEQRAQLRQFCEETGKRLFPQGKKFWFGYEDSQSLVVFPTTVPNNSLPILWHDEGGWVPLFPASGRAPSGE
jgi:hypothetical protein